ncbi:MAG: zinc ribbon domain-containing protein [Planctomycetes bacterium]|nr:zinc ribbon domain-containing protein [Planctomycetota bacterium]
MPTYEYVCKNCGHQFEKFQSITANSLRKCPQCGKMKLQRLIGSGAGIIFKGSGFYQTDYRTDSYKSGEKKEKEQTKKAAEKTTTSETKSKEKKAPAAKDTDKKKAV